MSSTNIDVIEIVADKNRKPQKNPLEKSLSVLEGLVDKGALHSFKTKHSDAPLYIDFGLSDGADTRHHLSRGYSTISVDAYAPWIEKAKEEFKDEVNDGRAVFFNVGVSTKDEDSLRLYFKEEGSVIASFEPSKGCQNISPSNPRCKHIDVAVVKCEAVFQIAGRAATVAKVDIEMLHHACIRGLKNVPTKILPKVVCWEEHDKPFGSAEILRPITDVKLILGLSELGYDKVKVILSGPAARRFYQISEDQAGTGKQSGTMTPEEMMHYRSYEQSEDRKTFDTKWRSVSHVLKEGMFYHPPDSPRHYAESLNYFDVCMKLGDNAEKARDILSRSENFPLSSYHPNTVK